VRCRKGETMTLKQRILDSVINHDEIRQVQCRFERLPPDVYMNTMLMKGKLEVCLAEAAWAVIVYDLLTDDSVATPELEEVLSKAAEHKDELLYELGH
jgi:hypothetical protein